MAVKFNPFSGQFDMVGNLAISQVLTGYTSGAGTVASTDTILQAIQKLNGNDALAISQVLTGYTSGAGTVSASDTILQAIQKLNGNDALKLPLAGGTMSGAILAPDGTSSFPSYAFSNSSGSGISYLAASTRVLISVASVNVLNLSTTEVILNTSSPLLRVAAQTGSDTAGTNLTLGAGAGTGAGTVSSILFQTPTVNGSGSTTQANATRLTLNSSSLTTTVPIYPNVTNSIALGTNTIAYSEVRTRFVKSDDNQNLVINAPGTGTLGISTGGAGAITINTATISSANTGGITISSATPGTANFNSGALILSTGIPTGSGIKGTIILGIANTNAAVYKLTNAGSNVNPTVMMDGSTASASIASGINSLSFDGTNGLVFSRGNTTPAKIGRSYINLINTTDTAGSEAGDLGFYTQLSGAAAALRLYITATSTSSNITVASASGTNIAGTNFSLTAGAGTGTGINATNISSTIDFYTPVIGATGSVAQTQRKCFSFGYVEASTQGSAIWLTSGAITQSNYHFLVQPAGGLLFQAGTGQSLQFKDGAGSSIYFTMNSNTAHLGNSTSSIYRTSNAGGNITARFMTDPANTVATAGSLAYGFDLTNGLIFTHANGTLRIMGWGAKLTNLVNTAGSESSDITWTPQNVSDKFIIGGALNLNQYTGTGTAIAEIDSNGNIIRGDAVDSMTISDATIITQLTTGGNWTGSPVAYTGSAISGAKQGQFYNNGTYLYLFVDNTTPKRLAYA
jgi:hypothetical protein